LAYVGLVLILIGPSVCDGDDEDDEDDGDDDDNDDDGDDDDDGGDDDDGHIILVPFLTRNVQGEVDRS
jgi:hypothetical protein